MDNKENNNRIKALRYAKCLKQVEMAEELGVSQQTISRLENCPNKIPIDLLTSVAKYFNVTIDYLLGLSNYDDSSLELYLPIEVLVKEYQRLTSENKKIVIKVINGLLVLQK